jgi:GAF domain
MEPYERLRAGLGAALEGADPGLSTADRLCQACVELLEVDGAAISVTHEGSTRGTFGSSGELSRRLDEYQFTFGEGPCLDSVRTARPVLVADLGDRGEQRWPAYAGAVLESGVRAVYALPVTIAAAQVGALDLFRSKPGPLTEAGLVGGLMAAELAAVPLLDLMTGDIDWAALAEGGDGWSQLASLERVEVYQATGMLMGQLGVGPADALIRLRGHAFATGATASEVAWNVVERRLALEPDDSWRRPDASTGTSS